MTLRRAMPICAMLVLVAAAQAGVNITLVPDHVPIGDCYLPGEVIKFGVFAHLTAGTPSVPGPEGTTTQVWVRRLQFDLRATSPEILAGIEPVLHHPFNEANDPDGDGIYDPIPFWDLSFAPRCSEDPSYCGTNYFLDGDISPPSDTLLTITYVGHASRFRMTTLHQASPTLVGEFKVTYPSAPGAYVLDVINSDTTDLVNAGAQLWWGFGKVVDPTDPASPLFATGFTGGQFCFCIPEPATLFLLSLGGLGALFGRRSAR